jgi:hypothetical protein
MKIGVFVWFLLVLFVLPAHSGHGTIQETETAIIIEYSGDASDNLAGTKAEEQPAGQAQAQKNVAPPTAVNTGALPQAVKVKSDDRSSEKSTRAEQDEARRKQAAEKRAARRGVRQPGAEKNIQNGE